ncbi:MAG: HU family DNA-binding protein [Alphaproteobacteria bacterium]|nr:HU family DNA-binding protein [Alphaproteobacteria bacterium]
MNKNEFIAAVCEQETVRKLELPKSAVAVIMDACLQTIEDTLKKGDEVRLVGFGHFYVAKREESKGRNPRTGEEITIKASSQPKFRAGKQLRENVGE